MTEKHPMSDILKELLRTGGMVGPLKMEDGSTSASITASTSLPGQHNQKERDWAFIVPDGYIRFEFEKVTDRHSGDTATCDWANSNPADGTIHAYVRASQTNGYAHAAASNVYAITPEAAANLYQQSLNSNES